MTAMRISDSLRHSAWPVNPRPRDRTPRPSVPWIISNLWSKPPDARIAKTTPRPSRRSPKPASHSTRRDEARAWYRLALSHDPNNAELKNALFLNHE